MSRIVVVGSLHFDMIVDGPRLPRLGETLPGSAWRSTCGGKGGNQAVAAARHGAAVTMVGCVGDDSMGAQLRANLERAGVATGLVRTGAPASGLSVVISEPGGDYAAVIVSGANQALDASDLRGAAPMIAAARVLVLQNEIPDAVNLAAARLAREAGCLVLLNAAPARTPPDGLYALVDILVVNAIEAEMLGAAPVADRAGAERAAAHLAARVPVAIVTAGGDGAALHGPDHVASLAPHPVRVVGTHGAGDMFVGALAARLAAGDALPDALAYANAAAACLVSTAPHLQAALGEAETRQRLGSGRGSAPRLDRGRPGLRPGPAQGSP